MLRLGTEYNFGESWLFRIGAFGEFLFGLIRGRTSLFDVVGLLYRSGSVSASTFCFAGSFRHFFGGVDPKRVVGIIGHLFAVFVVCF